MIENSRQILVQLMIGMMLIGTHMEAQTLFVRPDTTPNYNEYRYLDECASAIARKAAETTQRPSRRLDTARYDVTPENQPHPASAVAEGRLCLQSLNVDTISFTDSARTLAAAVALLLTVGNRDADVQRLFHRWIEATPADSLWSRYAMMLSQYAATRPIRLEKLRETWPNLLRQLETLGGRGYSRKAKYGRSYAEAERNYGDTSIARQVGWKAVQWNDSIPAEQRSKPRTLQYLQSRQLIPLYEWLIESQLLDSISASSAAYRNFWAGVGQRIMGDSNAVLDSVLGEVAPQLSADVVFHVIPKAQSTQSTEPFAPYERLSTAQQSPRPVSGRVNLIAFLANGCHMAGRNGMIQYWLQHWRGEGGCQHTIAALRRLKQRFPEVELTVVTKTLGSLGGAPVISNPTDEADTLAKFFLGFHRIPGTLIVTFPKFWYLPNPDNRRIDERTENETNYTWDIWDLSKSPDVVAVDETGVIFHFGSLRDKDEIRLEKKLMGVFRRIHSANASRPSLSDLVEE